LITCGAAAQNYPSKPIRMVDGFPPGGGTDFLSRTLGQKITENWGQPVIVDNRPGASSNIGAGIAAKSNPDGYTLFMGLTSVLAPSMALYSKLPYDLLKDLAPVSRVASGAYVLLVTNSIAARSVKDLVAAAKARPGQFNYASSGVGSPSHLAGELFNLRAGVKTLHIAYKGGAPAASALAAGESQFTFVSVPASVPLVKSGKATAIAVTTPQRSRGLPDVPTIAESGLPGFDITVTYGIFAPAGTPREIISTVNNEVVRVLKLADVVERLAAFGLEARSSTPQEFAQVVRDEVKLWAQVVKDAGISIQ
jgi:tripartite-type tricarboxylate transporter receptor subunit TctC